MNGKRWGRQVLRVHAAAVALWAISGCAALQIDVDVYKGPLIHDDDTQVQQLASITMSAKTLLATQRNQVLEDLNKNWAAALPSGRHRGRHLDPVALEKMLPKNCAVAAPASASAPEHGSPAACRQAKLLNDILSSYEDQAPGGLADAFVDVQRSVELLQGRVESVRRAMSAPTANASRNVAAAAAEDALGETWRSTLALLRAAATDGAAEPENLLRSRRQIREEAAALLAKLSEPAWVVAAAQSAGIGSVFADRAGRICHAMLSKPKQVDVAQFHLAAALQHANEQSLAQVAALALKPTAAREKVVAICTELAPSSANDVASLDPRAGHVRLSDVGVHRSPLTSENSLDIEDLEELFRRISSFASSGFDQGRTVFGLDRLANDAANARERSRSRTRSGTSSDSRTADSPETHKLQDGAADLAARMQFLATNLHLIEGQSGATNRFKTTLETVANTIMVMVEDLRRQRDHRERIRGFGDEEFAAATAALRPETSKRFDQLLAHAMQEVAAAKGRAEAARRRTGVITSLTEAKTRSESLAAAARGRLAAIDSQSAGALALLVTMDGKRIRNYPAAVQADAADAAATWQQDSLALGAALGKVSAPATPTQAADALKKWLKDEIDKARAVPDAAAAGAAAQRLARLQAALAAAERLRFAEGPANASRSIALAVQAVRQQTGSLLETGLAQRTPALNEVQTASAAETSAGKRLTDAKSDDERQKKSDAALPTAEQAQAATNQLARWRAEVLGQQGMGEAIADHKVMAKAVADLITKAEKDAKDADKPALQTAANFVKGWSPSPLQEFALTKPKSKTEGNGAIEVIDHIEAYLDYQRIEAIRTGGPSNTSVAGLAEAREQLLQRRNRLIYLRPASTYLRSSLASSFQQSDPGLDWSNMLAETFKRVLRSKEYDPGSQTAQVRAELDKAFWQNVNRVRVSAAGDSNFAIAKDDVGNWYVKSMGSDPKAMINTAKNLALFNIGGRIGTNLLRIDELRQGLRDPDRDRLAADYAEDKSELDDLLKRESGPAAGAYGNTLNVFKGNHDRTVKQLSEELADALETRNFLDKLKRGWADIYPQSDKRVDVLNAIVDLETGEPRVQIKAALSAITEPPLVAESTASNRLIDATAKVAALRKTIRTQIDGTTALTEDAEKAYKAAATELDKADTELRAEADAMAKLAAPVRDDEAKPISDMGLTGTALLDETKAREVRRGDLARKSVKVAALRDLKQKASSEAGKKAADLSAAKALKNRAMAEVDAVVLKLAQGIATRHLRAVEEFETAARVVSQGVTAKSGGSK